MRKISAFMSLFSTLFLLTGCFSGLGFPTQVPSVTPIVITEFPLPTEQPTKVSTGLTDELLRNSTYLSPQAQAGIKLVNGEFSGSVNGMEISSVMYPDILHGDVNEDGIEDAAFLISENTGGSGIFVSLIIVYSKDGEFNQAPGYFIDDRPVINSFSLMNGEVVVGANIHGPNDPMVNPTWPAIFHFDVFDKTILLTGLTTGAGENSSHAILIDSPAMDEVVTGDVTLTGSMPIGPFENNLSFRILDLNGQELFHSGFMVQAEDLGAPATFKNKVSLGDLPIGQKYILELCEISMADGSPLAVDTVLVDLGGVP